MGWLRAYRQAWLFLAWSRYVRQRDFNPRAGLQTRSIQFAVASDYPLWLAYRMRGPPPQREHDFVRLWIARWISAAGLLAFWQRISAVPARDITAVDADMGITLMQIREEPQWSLGIGANGLLSLCLATPMRAGPATGTA